MRLIDADKLELKHYVQRVTDKPIGYGGTQPVYANYDIIAYDVDHAPTVEAIPIEWIKKQIEKYVEWTTFKFHIDVDDIEARNCLEYLLEDWEKENETNQQR